MERDKLWAVVDTDSDGVLSVHQIEDFPAPLGFFCRKHVAEQEAAKLTGNIEVLDAVDLLDRLKATDCFMMHGHFYNLLAFGGYL